MHVQLHGKTVDVHICGQRGKFGFSRPKPTWRKGDIDGHVETVGPSGEIIPFTDPSDPDRSIRPCQLRGPIFVSLAGVAKLRIGQLKIRLKFSKILKFSTLMDSVQSWPVSSRQHGPRLASFSRVTNRFLLITA